MNTLKFVQPSTTRPVDLKVARSGLVALRMDIRVVSLPVDAGVVRVTVCNKTVGSGSGICVMSGATTVELAAGVHVGARGTNTDGMILVQTGLAAA